MMNENKIDEFIRRVITSLPADIQVARKDLENNLKAAFHGAFARMDLVTREEFDVQAELLSRTRAALEELGKKLAALEQSTSKHSRRGD